MNSSTYTIDIHTVEFVKRITKVLVVSIVILALGMILGSRFVDAHSNPEDLSSSQKYYKSIEISYGDTLWGIAEQYKNDAYESTNDYIDEIKEINGLLSDDIGANQYLTVAYYDNDKDSGR